MFSEAIRHSRNLLEREGLVEVSLELTPEESAYLKQIRILQGLPQFDFYGPAGAALTTELAVYLGAMGDNETELVLELARCVTNITRGLCAGLGRDWAWTMVRVSLPTPEFTVPRWHPDGSYFSSTDKQYKLVTTLKGAPTLFGHAVHSARFEALLSSDPSQEDLEVRRRLDEEVVPIPTQGNGYAMVYLVGDEDAIIHSEPNITEPRLFVAVVPGTQKQIMEWQRQRR